MDEQEHNKTPSDVPANEPTASTAGATPGQGASEPITELTCIPSPSLAPGDAAVSAASAPSARNDAGKPRASIAAKSIDDPRTVVLSAARPQEGFRTFTADAAPQAEAARRFRFRRLALPAVSIMLAIACGAAAGAAGVMSLGYFAPVSPATAPAPAPTPEVANLQATIAQMRSDITALKTSVDAAGRGNSAQFAKLAERFDRLERGQTTTAVKTDAALPKEANAKETTGSITPPTVSAALPPSTVPPLSSAALSPAAVVPGWAVRDVYRGVALLQSRAGGMVEVEAGDVLPGLGRIDAIRRQDGHWVVVTSHGTITSMR